MADRFRRWLAVWRRNALVWRKSAKTALLGGFAEPVFYLMALGYGLGSFIGQVQGLSYIGFLTAGILSTSAMNSATFEGLYLAYTRMEVLKTWDAMLAAPLSVADVVIGEVLWMGTKSVISAGLILAVAWGFGLAQGWLALAVLPVVFLTGICFGSMALVFMSFARSYDFFVYYISLGVTPLVLLSGVFFPLEALPEPVRFVTAWLPLQPVVQVIRPLVGNAWDWHMLQLLAIPAGYAAASLLIAIRRFERRLVQ
ncbi:MAG: nodulation protein NodJ [Methylococcaceae bacterium]|nr:nodulation protein NodJ [Methylococcaceae bacterium]